VFIPFGIGTVNADKSRKVGWRGVGKSIREHGNGQAV
jgi:hypothetical protein